MSVYCSVSCEVELKSSLEPITGQFSATKSDLLGYHWKAKSTFRDMRPKEPEWAIPQFLKKNELEVL